MNKPYFCDQNFSLTDWHHRGLKDTTDLLLFYGEHFCGFSESENEKNNSILCDLDNWFIISQKNEHFIMSI